MSCAPEDSFSSVSLWSRRGFLKTAAYIAATSAAGGGAEMFGQPVVHERILVPRDAHPAVRSASAILADQLGIEPSRIGTTSRHGLPGAREIVFAVAPGTPAQARLLGATQLMHDGYAVMAHEGGLLVMGARPRSLLFAAGEPHHWIETTQGEPWLRNPSFAIRCSPYHEQNGIGVAKMVALLGVNFFTTELPSSPSFESSLPEVHQALPADERARLVAAAKTHTAANAKRVKEFRDADVTLYALLPYGNNFSRWSPSLYHALLQVYPTARGVPEAHSWEKAALCPSDPATWRAFEAYVREVAEQTQADGVSATFWDQYGIFCNDPRCLADGLDQFKNELYAAISHYKAALAPTGQKLHLRTWSSGCPHWLGDEYVHAPGYGQFSESHYELWSRVVRETSPDILMQTKVYHSDCEPDPPFSTLLGKCKPHTEIVEYQVTGQTIGRQYFPASVVNYMAWTLKRALALVGSEGGAQIDAGGTHQSNYNVYNDIANNCNVYAWRELTWNVNADLDRIWLDWATPIYGPQAAPQIVQALRLSEEAVYRTFSPLGFGSDTNSNFAGNIARRETLLRYTNRNYLPEYTKFLLPTEQNIELVAAEKARCRATIDAMFTALIAARPHLTQAQANELETRFDWLREFSICNTTLDTSLWRYRYLLGLEERLTTDPAQMQPLADAYDTVVVHEKNLFRYDPSLKFSCYDTTLENLAIKPGLGNPMPLMEELYVKSRIAVEESTGPEGVPVSARRMEAATYMPAPRTQRGLRERESGHR